MNVYAIGDLHLGHQVNKPMEVFGAHWLDHIQKIKINWEKQILKEDIILIPGDISWAMRLKEALPDLEWLNQLPGQKICIRGNHDYWWDRPSPLNRLYGHIYFLQNTVYPLGNIGICGSRGWPLEGLPECEAENKRMLERECLRLKLSLDAAMKANFKEIWVMLHYPPALSSIQDSPFISLLKQYPVTKVIYGHLHDEVSWQNALIGENDGIEYNLVAADYLNFNPIKIGQIERS